mmetsp:Transcript_72358/g.169444  ORF Transcript_72358/g.169444 Transcript_72358/m.169444 type:complete len:217 (+) Transcript_72358:975-1625(+)
MVRARQPCQRATWVGHEGAPLTCWTGELRWERQSWRRGAHAPGNDLAATSSPGRQKSTFSQRAARTRLRGRRRRSCGAICSVAPPQAGADRSCNRQCLLALAAGRRLRRVQLLEALQSVRRPPRACVQRRQSLGGITGCGWLRGAANLGSVGGESAFAPAQLARCDASCGFLLARLLQWGSRLLNTLLPGLEPHPAGCQLWDLIPSCPSAGEARAI